MKNFTNFKNISTLGFSLVELMIAMTLGLLVVGATMSIFTTNKQAYRTTENLGRVQENGRTAFELMARDVREAGGNPCDKNLPVANVLNNAGTWWASAGNGVQGYDNGALAGSTAGTDAIEVSSGQGSGVTITTHNPTSAQFKVNTVNHNLNDSDIVMVCDFRQAAILQVTNASPGINDTIVHNTGGGSVPGNCSKGLGFAVPMNCSATGTPYAYGPNSQIVKFTATQWYVNNNILFRRTLRNNAPQVEEVIDGVQDMQITYLLTGSANYVAANAVPAGRWTDVVSVRVNLMLQSDDAIGTGGVRLQRPIVQTINLRNRTS